MKKFTELMEALMDALNEDELLEIAGGIDKAFDKEQITAKQHHLLHKLVNRLAYTREDWGK